MAAEACSSSSSSSGGSRRMEPGPDDDYDAQILLNSDDYWMGSPPRISEQQRQQRQQRQQQQQPRSAGSGSRTPFQGSPYSDSDQGMSSFYSLESLDQALSMTIAALEAKTNCLGHLRHQLEHMETDLKETSAERWKAVNQMEDAQSENSKLKEKITNIEEDLKNQMGLTSKAETDHSKLQADFQQLNAKHVQIVDELREEREKRNREGDSKTEELQRALARAAEEKRLRDRAEQNMPQEMVEYRERCETLERLLNETRSALQDSMKSANSKIEEEKRAKETALIEIEQLQGCIAQVNQDLRSEREARRAEREKFQEEVDLSQYSPSDSKEELRRCLNRLKAETEELGKTRAELEVQRTLAETTRKKNDELQIELDQALSERDLERDKAKQIREAYRLGDQSFTYESNGSAKSVSRRTRMNNEDAFNGGSDPNSPREVNPAPPVLTKRKTADKRKDGQSRGSSAKDGSVPSAQ